MEVLKVSIFLQSIYLKDTFMDSILVASLSRFSGLCLSLGPTFNLGKLSGMHSVSCNFTIVTNKSRTCFWHSCLLQQEMRN